MMEDSFHLKKFPDLELIREISLETDMDPAFIEKDWYAVQLLSLIAQRNKTSPVTGSDTARRQNNHKFI